MAVTDILYLPLCYNFVSILMFLLNVLFLFLFFYKKHSLNLWCKTFKLWCSLIFFQFERLYLDCFRLSGIHNIIRFIFVPDMNLFPHYRINTVHFYFSVCMLVDEWKVLGFGPNGCEIFLSPLLNDARTKREVYNIWASHQYLLSVCCCCFGRSGSSY